MWRRTDCLLAGVLLVVPALGSDAPKGYDGAAEIDGIEGTWQAVSVENTGGTFLTPPEWRMTFRAGKFTWTGGGIHPQGSYKVDAGKKPAWLDMTYLPEGDPTLKNIFRIDGDILKIAWTLGDGERPQRFDIHGDRRQSVSTFKRVR
jgi:uncharacterized protein (TIGR03067 family)